ncbi:MAG: shikimate kinase [Cyclobacteriaceae bacterium]
MKIFLIGMPGSGKTTFGRELASRLMVEFVDLDAEIEKAEQKSISEIFRENGEEYFRLLEARLLREWAARALPFVMATGGGAPCFHRGMETINEYGISIFLDFAVPVLMERVRRNQERPLLLTSDEKELAEKLERMRTQRLDCYRKAKIVLENPTLESLLKNIHAKK